MNVPGTTTPAAHGSKSIETGAPVEEIDVAPVHPRPEDRVIYVPIDLTPGKRFLQG